MQTIMAISRDGRNEAVADPKDGVRTCRTTRHYRRLSWLDCHDLHFGKDRTECFTDSNEGPTRTNACDEGIDLLAFGLA